MFHHSHIQYQRGDGLFGPYIVRQSKEKDPNFDQYDFDLTEHSIMVQEYFHESTKVVFALHHWDQGKNKADNIIINGRGRKSRDQEMPLSIFKVQSGKRYRFRVISPGITMCPIQMSIEDHPMTIIASDVGPVKPLTVDSFLISPGERFDFVLTANQTSKGAFVMRFGGYLDCAWLKTQGKALLVYDKEDVPNQDIEQPVIDEDYSMYVNALGRILSPVNYAPKHDEQFEIKGHIPVNKLELHPQLKCKIRS